MSDFCPNCKKKISQNAKFCGFCGYKINDQTEREKQFLSTNSENDNKTKRKNFKPSTILVVIAGLSISAFLIILLTPTKEEKYWKKVSEENSIASFDNYLKRYPDGKFFNEAFKNKDKKVWNLSRKINTVPSYKNYIKKNPKGAYIEEALSRIEKIKKEQNQENRIEKKKEQIKKNTQKTSKKIPGRFPQATARILNNSDLNNLTKWELRVMRNEIFARHGYVFKTDIMSGYFNKVDWYNKIDKLNYSNNASNLLTNIEKKNIKLIQKYEGEIGVKLSSFNSKFLTKYNIIDNQAEMAYGEINVYKNKNKVYLKSKWWNLTKGVVIQNSNKSFANYMIENGEDKKFLNFKIDNNKPYIELFDVNGKKSDLSIK
jgi:hypothetical protein